MRIQSSKIYPSKNILNSYFSKCKKEFDSLEVIISKDSELYFSLYGCDCDSIIVMNPSKMIQENE